MQEHLFNQKPFKKTFLPNGVAEDAEAEVKPLQPNFGDIVDLQILRWYKWSYWV